ncbi:MAG: succinate--CoA ligase subunit alpha, partial [Acidimicrobiales bacterium]|nr:succinate--CoA ligase subunit alpha [Acidimicrobiales bacterium]
KGLNFIELLSMFNDDPDTDGVVMIGEIGGSDETLAGEWIRDNMTKPVAAFIAGRTAPPGKRMGHAGAIVSGGKGTADAKMEALSEAGVRVGLNPTEAGELMAEIVATL